jgi:Tol biopolymer transport system component
MKKRISIAAGLIAALAFFYFAFPISGIRPLWTPNGRRIVYSSRRGERLIANLYWRPSDGSGDEQRLTEGQNPQFPGSWHPSGTLLAFTERRPKTNGDLMLLPIEGGVPRI